MNENERHEIIKKIFDLEQEIRKIDLVNKVIKKFSNFSRQQEFEFDLFIYRDFLNFRIVRLREKLSGDNNVPKHVV